MGDFHMDIDGLAPMIFLRNPNDLPIKINLLDPIQNGKDLFFFLPVCSAILAAVQATARAAE